MNELPHVNGTFKAQVIDGIDANIRVYCEY